MEADTATLTKKIKYFNNGGHLTRSVLTVLPAFIHSPTFQKYSTTFKTTFGSKVENNRLVMK